MENLKKKIDSQCKRNKFSKNGDQYSKMCCK